MNGLPQALVALCLGLGLLHWAVFAQQGDSVQGNNIEMPESEAEGDPATLQNWRCKYYPTGCPSGFKRDTDGNYVGCSGSGQPVSCSGRCSFCTGSVHGLFFCEIRIGHSCDVATGTGTAPVACGTVTYHDCVPLAMGVDPGGITPPNGCGCSATGTSSSERCFIRECIQ